MIALKQILVPTDFSEPSAVALKYARAFATTFGASLHLLHVIETSALFTAVPDGVFLLTENLWEQVEHNARTQLVALLPEDEQKAYQARQVTRQGSPFVEIVRYAREQDIDLIIMGTHGRGPIAHMLLGSVAEKVVRKAPCPVLTVRQPEHEFVMP